MTTSIKYSVHQCCDVKKYLGEIEIYITNSIEYMYIDFVTTSRLALMI